MMLAKGIISPVTAPTNWVNSIVCNMKKNSRDKKVWLLLSCLKEAQKARENYNSRDIDEIHVFFSTATTQK